jgi:CheY-like chemotaxis protein
VLQKIRQWEASKDLTREDRAKVIMLYAQEPDSETAFQEGWESYIVKPVTADKLTRAFGRVHYI